MTTTWPIEMSRLINDYAGPFLFWTQAEADLEAPYEAQYQEFLQEQAEDRENAYEAALDRFGGGDFDSDFEEWDYYND